MQLTNSECKEQLTILNLHNGCEKHMFVQISSFNKQRFVIRVLFTGEYQCSICREGGGGVGGLTPHWLRTLSTR